MRALWLIAAMALVGCTDEQTPVGPRAGEGGGPPSECADREVAAADGTCLRVGVQPDGCPAGQWGSDGACLDAGVQADGCAAGTLMVDSVCRAAGVPEDKCGAGFVADGEGGCVATLPAQDCGPGTMAIMGETTCRAVAPCGQARFGAAPTDGSSQFVDQAYDLGGGASDGSEARPWKTINEALAVAASGAVIALAAGDYPEDLLIQKPVRIWGRCPAMVSLSGATGAATIILRAGASASELHDLAITGSGVGIDMAGVSGLVFDRLWVHDTGSFGVAGVDAAPATAFTLTRSLIESAYDIGLRLYGTDASIQDSIVRDTRPTASRHGWGITLQEDEVTFKRPTMTLSTSLIERSGETGVFIYAADALLEAVYIRDTQSRASGKFGRGIGMQSRTGTANTGANVTVVGSLIENNQNAGIFVSASHLIMRHTVVRDTLADGLGLRGNGVAVLYDPTASAEASVVIEESVIERSTELGVLIAGSDAELKSVVIRDTRSATGGSFGRGLGVQGTAPDFISHADVRGCLIDNNQEAGISVEGSELVLHGSRVSGTDVRAVDRTHGHGVFAEHSPDTGFESKVTISACAFAANHTAGIFHAGGSLEVWGTAIKGTLPQDPTDGPAYGRGINIQENHLTGGAVEATIIGCAIEKTPGPGIFAAGVKITIDGTLVAPSSASERARGINVQSHPMSLKATSALVRWSLVTGARDSGIFVAGSDLQLEASSIEGTLPDHSGLFGDGLSLVQALPKTSGTVKDAHIARSGRAGIVSFATEVGLKGVVLECNRIALAGENGKIAFAIQDQGGNICRCDEPEPCLARSAGLEPPKPLGVEESAP